MTKVKFSHPTIIMKLSPVSGSNRRVIGHREEAV